MAGAVRKLAVFVEGQTEQFFVERLIREIAGEHRVGIDVHQLRGGRQGPRISILTSSAPKPPGADLYVLLYNSCADNAVASDIRERYQGLVDQGFSAIIGLRDLYPLPLSRLPQVRKRLLHGQKTRPFPPLILLAVMEIEAWFLAETDHFPLLEPSLTPARIQAELGLDLTTLDVREVAHPSETLHTIYRLASLSYTKRARALTRTVDALDYAGLYTTLRPQIPELDELCAALDRFIAPPKVSPPGAPPDPPPTAPAPRRSPG